MYICRTRYSRFSNGLSPSDRERSSSRFCVVSQIPNSSNLSLQSKECPLRLIRRNAMTLLEIMIVIFLIGLIASVIGYNMKGSLDEGRAFKTRQAKEQIHDILLLEYANHNFNVPLDQIIKEPERHLTNSGMVKNPKDLLMDGWGKRFDIKIVNGDIKISSKSLDDYEKKKNRNPKSSDSQEEEDEM